MDLRSEFFNRLTPSQRNLVGYSALVDTADVGKHKLQVMMHPWSMTQMFHAVFGFPAAQTLVLNPTVTDRERRLRLIFEEFCELCEAMGFKLAASHAGWEIRHVEGSRYDPVETADALGDLNVVVNGTSVELGIPQIDIDREIFLSNMTKLASDGTAIVNGITEGYREGEDGFRPDAPIGKGLKGPNYVNPNIPAILYRSI